MLNKLKIAYNLVKEDVEYYKAQNGKPTILIGAYCGDR